MISPHLIKRETARLFETKEDYDYWDKELKKPHERVMKLWNMFLKRVEGYKQEEELKKGRENVNTKD